MKGGAVSQARGLLDLVVLVLPLMVIAPVFDESVCEAEHIKHTLLAMTSADQAITQYSTSTVLICRVDVHIN